jgi:hypothetical protein
MKKSRFTESPQGHATVAQLAEKALGFVQNVGWVEDADIALILVPQLNAVSASFLSRSV